ncbi:MAG: transcription antitermination factor NusB [Synergistaceae bacterium]|nr:transcription antitermination factor NusB [Synergistaceae bacterium]
MGRATLPQRRRRAREIALQLVYELDLRGDISPEEALDMFPFDDEDPEVAGYAKSLVLSVSERADEVDEILREHIVGWRTERMVAVDRAAIRIALCEGMLDGRVPVAVAISEAVELTKMFGTVESSKFVNGVLGRIVRSPHGRPACQPEAGVE